MKFYGSGSRLWVIELNSAGSYTIPVERARLRIAIKSIFFSIHEDTPLSFGMIVAHAPYFDDTSVYLPGGQNFTQLAVYCTENKRENIYIDFSDNIRFHIGDFVHSETLTLDVRNLHGQRVTNIAGMVVFEIQKLSDL